MSLKSAPSSLQVPYSDPIGDAAGLVTKAWQFFFRDIRAALDPLGVEQAFILVNNQGSAANIDGMLFSSYSVSQAFVDYLIQRVTTGGGAIEKIETGTFSLIFKPTSNTWVLSNGPSSTGITLSVLSTGQVQYTSSNEGGTASISKIVWRSRSLAAKNQQYSKAGR